MWRLLGPSCITWHEWFYGCSIHSIHRCFRQFAIYENVIYKFTDSNEIFNFYNSLAYRYFFCHNLCFVPIPFCPSEAGCALSNDSFSGRSGEAVLTLSDISKQSLYEWAWGVVLKDDVSHFVLLKEHDTMLHNQYAFIHSTDIHWPTNWLPAEPQHFASCCGEMAFDECYSLETRQFLLAIKLIVANGYHLLSLPFKSYEV